MYQDEGQGWCAAQPVLFLRRQTAAAHHPFSSSLSDVCFFFCGSLIRECFIFESLIFGRGAVRECCWGPVWVCGHQVARGWGVSVQEADWKEGPCAEWQLFLQPLTQSHPSHMVWLAQQGTARRTTVGGHGWRLGPVSWVGSMLLLGCGMSRMGACHGRVL
jgi:hypothetical protein